MVARISAGILVGEQASIGTKPKVADFRIVMTRRIACLELLTHEKPCHSEPVNARCSVRRQLSETARRLELVDRARPASEREIPHRFGMTAFVDELVGPNANPETAGKVNFGSLPGGAGGFPIGD